MASGRPSSSIAFDEIARHSGYVTGLIEAPEGQRLATLLVPAIRSIALRLSRQERAKEAALDALRAIRSFASAFKVTFGAATFEVQPEPGIADSGELGLDVTDLFAAVATAAKANRAGVALLIDELQYLAGEDFGALIVAMHRISQRNLPMMFFGAGLPQLTGLAGDAKSYAERLFRYPQVGQLTPAAAADAIAKPLADGDVEIQPEALSIIIEKTEGYPYFLQEWGFQSWEIAPASPITVEDVRAATQAALDRLDSDFFKVRFDHLTPREKEYARAIAHLGPGAHRSADIAKMLHLRAEQASPLRDQLIKKGMIYSRERGVIDFTVPLFDAFMRRAMPDWNPPIYTVRRGKAKRGRRRG